MGCHRLLIRLGIIFTSLYLCHGCQLEGVSNLPLPVSESFLDTFRGTILNRTVSEIEGINGVPDAAGVNFGPYVDVILTETHFAIVTNDAFDNYEEYETSDTFSITITFACTGSSTRTLVFVLTVIDTNNNAPRFTPSNEIEFSIALPVPPGFVVTGCLNDIIARDIDLTTQRIEFIIEENPYFEIAYDEASSTEAKEFKATLRTTTLIRSFPEPIILAITATDVDLTGDPPLTTAATLRIVGDTGFEFPEEPVFSQAFYLANYTIDNQITHESMALEQGFDEQVQFVLEGEYASNFELAVNGGQLILSVISPLPTDVFVETQIVLVVRASREYTSGATAAIIVQLPEAASLEFERVHYEGSIVNNVLQVPQLTLLQGYDDSSLLVLVRSEYSQYFATAVQGNLITLTMSPLPGGIIEENNFIYLEIVASIDHSSASTIVTLEIIKDDNVTPVFSSPLYTGTYESTTGLSVQQIVIVQGYDDTVTLDLEGTHASYFQLSQVGNIITLTSSTIPPAIYAEQQVILIVVASKPRTVGANAVVIITLPTARELRFDSEDEYRGSLRNNDVTLTAITLIEGYDDTVTFSLTGGFASYFRIIQSQNQAVVELATLLPDEVILASNNIILTIIAVGLNAVSRSATIVLDIVKDDVNTPVFSQNIYQGIYSNSFTFEVEDIYLSQGYNEFVSFRIYGDHAQYFDVSSTGNNVNILLQSTIPEELILNEKFLSFTILAEKELTVGANAAVLIKFPLELTEPALMRFSQNNYNGTIDSSSMELDSIVLDTGYAVGTVFILTGDYASYFTLSNNNNVVSLTLTTSLPQNVLEDTSFIVLDLIAERERAITAVATLVFDVIKEIIIPPIFGEPYYRGVYSEESGLEFNEEISLSTGYDETVVFLLDEEFATWFTLRQIDNNNMTLEAIASVPENILINNNQLIFTIVAIKPNAQSAQATISLDIIRTEIINPEFEQAYYTGSYSIESGLQFEDDISLSQGHDETVTFGLDGDLSTWFSLVQFNATTFTLISTTAVPIDILENNNQLLFTVFADKPSASNARAVVSLDVLRAEVIPPMFSEPFYSGEYTEESGLIFNDDISLSFGYDETVTFRLEGVLEPWLSIIQIGNSLTLVAVDRLPEDVLQNNNQLLFSILAEKPNSITGQAAIFIDLPKDIQEMRVLSFEENTYVGSLDNGEITLPTITLQENHGVNIQFNIYGDYASYFSVNENSNTITLQLINELPDEVVRNNVFITFDLVASSPGLLSGYSTVVLELIREAELHTTTPIFEQAYYTGAYAVDSGLTFEYTIQLIQGFDESVSFNLDGDDSHWFALQENGNNNLTLTLLRVPDTEDRSNLVFSIIANKPETLPGHAAVIISIADFYTQSLRFTQDFYTGHFDSENITISDEIRIQEGNIVDLNYTLIGGFLDYSNYFQLTNQGGLLALQLLEQLPEEIIQENSIILLTVEIQNDRLRTHATIILENVISTDSEALIEFEEPYYIGTYSEINGLTLDNDISLSQGYEESVIFNLNGNDAQYFALVRSGNSVTLTLVSPIPAAVLNNNRKLVFVITAQRAGSVTARSTVIISLVDEYTEGNALGFDRVTYVGTIENNLVTVQPITLSEGYTNDVVFSLHGELADYFSVSSTGAAVTIALQSAIPEQSLPTNRMILLEIQASLPATLPAYATVIFEVIVDEDLSTAVDMVFNEAYYIGTFTEQGGLAFTQTISLTEGYDDSVAFALDGDDAQYFALVRSGNSVTLTLVSPIPAAVLNNNRKLVFVITAQRAGSVTARSTVIISLVDEYTEGNALGFDRVTYVGTIENNLVTVQPITLSEGYTNDVVFSLHGELADYFSVSSTGAAVTIALQSAIPEQALPTNRMILLEIQASLPATLPAYATVIFEVIVDEDLSTAVDMVFNEAYYIGTFTEQGGLAFTQTISLTEGYDDSVAFALDGDDAQYFALVRSGNSVTLTLVSPIPAAVLNNNRKLVFVITAQRAGSVTARSTVIISLVDEYTEGNALGFDRVTYVGTIENNLVTVQPITLSEGYTNDVVFSLHGELADYFSVSSTGAAVTIALQSAIPEQSLPTNRMILLEIQASLPATLPAYATVIFEVIVDEDLSTAVDMVFNEAYYIGTFTEQGGLAFTQTISLTEGYDDSVAFALDGDDAQYFALVRSGNSVTLTLVSPIPAAVLNNNRKLVFVITAQRAGSVTARSTVIISLVDEYTEGNALGFDRVTYVGTIENNLVTVQPITLSEGYTNDVVFSLHGELADYFSVSSTGAAVTIALQSAIPEQSLPTNRMILLEIQASLPATLPAYATVIFEVIVDEDLSTAVDMVFNEAYYIGTFTEQGGLAFTQTISLTEGYDDSVAFALDGDDAQYFALVRSGNSVTLTLVSPIPAAVLNNNRKLVFVITAQRAGSVTARSTVIISLVDEYTEGNALGFDRVTYVGTIENNLVTVQPITLSEGYTNDVVFSLHGELADYFSVSSTGAAVTIALQSAIPEQSLPTNRMILLEIQASLPATLPAYATVIFEVIVDEDLSTAVDMVFNEAYYIGTFTEQGGLAFTQTISLTEGYDDSVAFALDGDDAQYFALVRSGNSVTLTLVSPIPAAVLNNNRKLVFVITAQRAGSVTARSTVIISLVDEYTEGNALGFDRVTYVGTIENNLVTVQPITLSEGYTNDVVFSLHGELADYFSVSSTGAAVTIALQSAIPEQSLPTNRMILLEIQASLPATLPAYATVIFEVIVDEDLSTAVDMVFNEAYYIGTFTEQGGLAFTQTISLTEGYDDSVAFALDGDDAQYFALVRSGNSVTLTLVSPIPAAVLNNNRKLVFVITAQRAGSVTARSTVIISLVDEYTEGNALGFDRVTYVGTIENNLVTVQPITLSEGYTNDVVVSLHGELADYFSVSSTGAAVTIALQSAIPEQSLPTNRMILLEIQASLPATLPAYATVIFEVIVDEDLSTVVDMVFNEAYYIGTFTEQGGLAFTQTISLTEGYDDSVAFALDGDDAQYFALVRSGNSVTLTLVSPIPAAVLNNNRKLVFVITAQRAGSVTARSTVIISLVDEYTEGNALGFDRVTYVGTIENNLVTVQPITLSEGYTNDVVFSLHGELADYFSVSSTGAAVTIALQSAIPEQSLPTNRMILLEIQASLPATLPAYATVIFEVIVDEDLSTAVDMVFNEAYYIGTFTEQGGLAFTQTISLTEGYDDSVAFALDGDDAQYFALVRSGNSVTLTLVSPIPAAVLNNNRKLVFVITAQRAGSVTARSTVIISIVNGSENCTDETFEKVLYEGVIQVGVVQHETIIILGYSGNDVQIFGEYAGAFVALVSNGEVSVQTGSVTLPAVTHLALELRAGGASAALILTVLDTGTPVLPTVTFSSISYALQVDIDQTGFVGRVDATADNGESIAYSLLTENAHLQSRLSINTAGELHLSAPVNIDFYNFEIIATTTITQVSATAPVYLTVNAVTVCGDNNVVTPPLIILNRDEEESHRNLVVINETEFQGCRYSIVNRWPVDQTWLYVDETGLHTSAIDREHESIAFMALSQVQVELTLNCEGDQTNRRSKRSMDTPWLGPYDYGTKDWILTDTILFNSRRSLVNLIVNDINDNAPVFVGKENEPIIVGYPVPELEDTVLPRSLAQLKATDADIGVNAELRYWSTDPQLAVAPGTGYVHVRDGARLEHDASLIVLATDRNGDGLSGSIQLQVKLLDYSHIVVVTVRNAFLDDEETILEEMSSAVGYEVKTLRSSVISDDVEIVNTRKNRVTVPAGASLQIFAYGLISREPVEIQRLITDLNNNAVMMVNVASILSLDDHLEAQEICVIPARDTGLLVATIVLSVLLFILIVAVVIWVFRKRLCRCGQNYQEFSDENSIASRNDSMAQLPKPEIMTKPRLDIEELKRSEKRLQDMLNAPIPEVAQPSNSKNAEAIIDMPQNDVRTPIVIQSIDKLKDADDDDSSEDEFGENPKPRRKSVVTFNENVEKIIHVDDNEDQEPDPEYEVYRF